MLKPVATLAGLVLLCAPASALARKGGDREVRTSASCGWGTKAKLKLKADDGAIEVEWEVDRARSGERWRVSLARDGRVLSRATVRTSGRSGSFSYERRISDLSGADRVSARASGPNGVTCAATATLPSS